jgi:superfamily II DNA or RNA helicase
MDRRPEIGMDSYDRLFPSQDTLPKGGYGNLIALPLQKKPRSFQNSVFIDHDFNPYPDQWDYLSSIKKLTYQEIETITHDFNLQDNIVEINHNNDDEAPWDLPPSKKRKKQTLKEPLPEQITIVLNNQIYIEKETTPPVLRNRLIGLASFQNPEFYRAEAMRRSTYNIPRILYCYETFEKHIGIPIGCLDNVVECIESLDIKLTIKDERFAGKPIHIGFLGTLREDQEKASKALLAYDMGILHASTAFGKTIVGIDIMVKRGVNTLILVHRKQLLEQWISRLTTFLDITPKMIGKMGSGVFKPSKIVDVAMIQSLNKKGVVNDIVGEYGHIIVDECHHLSARSFEIVVRQSKAKYITGLSATVKRKDGHEPIIFMNCGPVRYQVNDRLEAEKRSFLHKVMIRETGVDFPLELQNNDALPTINELYSFLSSHEYRNNLIVNDILAAINSSRFPLVLSERKSHIETLEALLIPHIEHLFVLTGSMTQKKRQMILEKLSTLTDNAPKLIIATGKLIGEGFDDARLDTLFLTMPVSWRGLLTQYAGRLHREHHMKKEVMIYDYADLNIPMLTKMYGKRVKGYKSIGYDVIEQEKSK